MAPTRHALAAAAILALALALAGCLQLANDGDTAHDKIMADARAASADLDTPEAAWAAGYRPVDVCVPGMGMHWLHKPGQPDSYFDTELDPAHPEVLMFLPDTGDLNATEGDKFLGVEYVVITQGTDMNTTETRPHMHGHGFDGPMPGHFPGMPWHAETHVYLAEGFESPEGFPPTAEGIECPEGTTGEIGLT